MALLLHLHVEAGAVRPYLGETPLADPVPLDALPRLGREDPGPLYGNPFEEGVPLFQALGGERLLEALDRDEEGVLLLRIDDGAEPIPWEFAPLPGVRDLLAARYGLVRLIDRKAPPAPQGPLHVVVLAADPLVDDRGRPREEKRLQFDRELRALRAVLEGSGKDLLAERIPPTRGALRRALRRGPVLLHLSAHGNVFETDRGPMAQLLLEDEDGGAAFLLGRDLVRLAPRGALRLALLSACRTAAGVPQARLARALVLHGVPAVVGMQGLFPDPLSGPFIEELLDALLADLSLAEALRQARMALLEQNPGAAGLPVLYAARDAWGSLSVPDGRPQVGDLLHPGPVRLPQEVQLPDPFLGRHADLHRIARLFSQGARVVTLTGSGGVGKTALAAAFAHRFAWRWPRGVAGLSFASGLPDPQTFARELVRVALGEEAVRRLAEADPRDLFARVLDGLRGWDGLLLLDNYESVLQALREEDDPDGPVHRLHRLVSRLAEGGQAFLVTSRELPTELPGETLYPERRLLPGLAPRAAAQLFLRHSARAKEEKERGLRLAQEVARATEGHPLAVALLAAEFDRSPEVEPEAFLEGWAEELRTAERPGLAAHHITFTAALERSYRHLDPTLQRRLRLLTAFSFPFFAEAAAFLWGLVDGEGTPDADAARPDLLELVRRSLLEVEGTFEGSDRPAVFRFLPRIREVLQVRVSDEEREVQATAFAAYGAWLAKQAYGEIWRDTLLARLTWASLPGLEAAVEELEGVERLWHIRRLAWLKRAYGDYAGALALLEPYREPALAEADAETRRAYSSLWYELAYIYRVRGDLDRAMDLYQQSLQTFDALGDLKGKAATLHEMANIHTLRGDLDRAMDLYQQVLETVKALGDLQGKAATLHEMAYIYRVRGDLDRAMDLYQRSLQIKEALGDLQGKAATLHEMAYIYRVRGDLDRAMDLYQRSLQTFDALGDLQGKAATLHEMAYIYTVRGDLDRAMDLYQQVLETVDALGDLQGKAATLHEMAYIYRVRGDLDRAMDLYQQSLQTFDALGDLQGKAATLGMMGQALFAAGRKEQGIRALLNGFLLLTQAGIEPRTQQAMARDLADFRRRAGPEVFDPIWKEATNGAPLPPWLTASEASASSSEPPPSMPDSVAPLLHQARAAVERGELGEAIRLQEEAVDRLRAAGEDRETLVALSVALFNLAGFYARAGRMEEAVQAMEEVVALDERTDHPDLESDREVLERYRQRAAGGEDAPPPYPPGEISFPSTLFPPQIRRALESLNQEREGDPPDLPPEVQAFFAALTQALETQGPQGLLVGLARDAAVAALRGERPRQEVIGALRAMVDQVRAKAPDDPAWADAARFLEAVVALLEDRTPPPVPERYAEAFAVVQQAAREAGEPPPP